MESHPVPQNVTNFEFHLVGDMTLKQFVYLAIGLAIAYLLFAFAATPLPFLAWPLIVISALTGIAFAFVPIQERPLDHWLKAYFSAIFNPTEREYKSAAWDLKSPEFNKRLDTYLQLANITPINNAPVSPPAPTQTATSNSVPQQAAQPQTPPPQPKLVVETQTEELPSKDDLKKTVELAKEAQSIQGKIFKAEQKLAQIKSVAAQPGTNPTEFTKQFQQVLSEIQNLNKEASAISHDLAILSNEKVQPRPTPAIPASQIKSIPALVLTQIANIINGIVTDTQGNYVEGAIIVAHDKQGLPVRALKSNKLGQFIAATPLPNGTYNMSIEKDNLIFDNIELELNGSVLKPIMIQAKKTSNVILG